MRKSDTDCRQIVRGDELDFEPRRLCLLLRLDEDVPARRTSLRFLRLQRYPERLQVTDTSDQLP